MSPPVAAVLAKARAFVKALSQLPRSAHSSPPHGHFARDYNTLRRLALEAMPDLDERLLGKYIHVQEIHGGEISLARYVEIEVYARQIMEQLMLAQTASGFSPQRPGVRKAYDMAAIRREHNQACLP